ncbi:hypothetical protein VIBNISOn1_90012 [Vibrio nigripulchritudo SOn1]|uniref:Uncharacterized protein n=1 Tax=Vibrio nigripulchritudo SOn1 TaxID=1238450 RepID=A0AAV2VZG2_9VIBR|nr:hypothetical protein [Vibrio nigripulchritudo]CCO49770.1 hypothetical protein VIBNISOn1_90012 [Vibrio nigripulchritudo SOn1]
MIGKILLASNIHPDSHLYAKVVLVIHNDVDGSIALTLNNNGSGGISDVDNIYCIIEGSNSILDGAIKLNSTKQLLLNDKVDLSSNLLKHYFEGCEKWGPNQLEMEIKMDGWAEISDMSIETLSSFNFFPVQHESIKSVN